VSAGKGGVQGGKEGISGDPGTWKKESGLVVDLPLRTNKKGERNKGKGILRGSRLGIWTKSGGKKGPGQTEEIEGPITGKGGGEV